MMTLFSFLLFLASLLFFWYGSSRYDLKLSHTDICWNILTGIASPFIRWGGWLRDFLRGGYKLFCKDAAPLRSEVTSDGEAAFEIAAIVTCGLGMVLGGIGTLVGIGIGLYEFFTK